MARTSRYARCESPKRSWTLSTTAANGQSQRNKETGEPDDATSIQSGSAGLGEKPKGPRSQPTQLSSDGLWLLLQIFHVPTPSATVYARLKFRHLRVRQQYRVVFPDISQLIVK